ncbi:chlorohydrolase [Levilactobacillus brevis]|uniref:guanine deaminase n=1 Tax=Levilactobacillus brevis TaxID=1580 RepID=UPI000948ED71|nr:guanine deaminase [Levilactobacillus brevis]OLF67008.1 chlorohydrolase [Levilactobacillus brevis]
MVFQGASFSPQDAYHVHFESNALLTVDHTGLIDRLIRPSDADYTSVRQAAQAADILQILPAHTYLLPGFIDLHVHAPQWPQAGLALDRPLNDWLNTYTFPLEARYADSQFAHRVYQHLIPELLANGTTTALYFGTIHHDANLELARACADYGQRGYIGQVVMDNPDQTPATYRTPSATDAINGTEKFVMAVQALAKQRHAAVTPVITPRFVPSCTPAALAGLGQLAQRYDLPIQSHCSESTWEDQYAQDHFHRRDAEVLDHFGLLTSRSVMAHGTQLSTRDLDLFHQRQTAVAHCPISNAYFGNAVFPVNQALHRDVKVGLGSDLSGGFTPSLYRNLQQAVMASQMRQDGVDAAQVADKRGVKDSRISATTAFYLATKGGATSLHLQAGQLIPSYTADFQVVHDRYTSLMPNDAGSIFERLMYHTTPADIQAVYVRGQRVHHLKGDQN